MSARPVGDTSAPRFTIVVPAFQAQATLAETLDAIVTQTFPDWECVVVDDGSTDETLPIANRYSQLDARIRVLHQDNQGTAGAYNTGVSSATGDFVVICSGDDILLPEHLFRMSALIDAEAGYDIYASNGYFWSPGVSKVLVYGPGERDTIGSFEFAEVIRRCFFSVGATYRRGLWAAIGGYRLGVYGEDYDFWLRAMASGARQRYLPEPLALHRVTASQKSAQLRKVFQSDIRIISDLRGEFQLSTEDDRVAEEAIGDRLRLIAQVDPPWGFVPIALRPVAKSIVIGLLGRDRSWRLARAMVDLRARISGGRSRS